VTPALRPKAEQDLFLREKLSAPAAQSAILAWAVRGCRDWLEHGLGTCAAVEVSTAEYRESQDRVAGFFSERCYFGPAERVAVKAIGAAYCAWCDENHVRQPLTAKELASGSESAGAVPARWRASGTGEVCASCETTRSRRRAGHRDRTGHVFPKTLP